jgi:hypothetical protein
MWVVVVAVVEVYDVDSNDYDYGWTSTLNLETVLRYQ